MFFTITERKIKKWQNANNEKRLNSALEKLHKKILYLSCFEVNT